MEDNVKRFLKAHRISVAGILQSDGSIHSATMHYAHTEEPLMFFFMTDKGSRKCRPLQNNESVQASLVIGFNEEEMATFQAEGEICFLKPENEQTGWETYTKKYPNRAAGKNDPDVVVLQFTPNWARFSDYQGQSPIESLLKSE